MRERIAKEGRNSGVRSDGARFRHIDKSKVAFADPALSHMKGYEDGLAFVECTFDDIWGSD